MILIEFDGLSDQDNGMIDGLNLLWLYVGLCKSRFCLLGWTRLLCEIFESNFFWVVRTNWWATCPSRAHLGWVHMYSGFVRAHIFYTIRYIRGLLFHWHACIVMAFATSLQVILMSGVEHCGLATQEKVQSIIKMVHWLQNLGSPLSTLTLVDGGSPYFQNECKPSWNPSNT